MGKVLVLIEVVSLVLITALIDESLMRVALSVVPGLLLTQRALEAAESEAEAPTKEEATSETTSEATSETT